MPYHFSPSSLSLLKECPRCFWLHFNKKIRRPSGIFPSLPGGMDKILKEHFDRFMEKGKMPPELKGVEKGTVLFDDKTLLAVWRNNRRGIHFTDKEGNIVHGAIDSMLKKGKKMIILDFKTRGYPLKEDTAGFYKDQLDLYNLMFRKKDFMTEDYSYLLFYYPKEVSENGDVIFDTELVKMKVDIKNAEDIIKKALKVLKSEMPKPSEDCEYCKWADICRI